VDNAIVVRAPAILLVCACYAPHPHAGGPCGADDACPSGLVCVLSTQTCELGPGGGDDAASHDARALDATGRCYGGGLATICPTTPPTDPLDTTTAIEIDTSSAAACTQITQGLCVIEATDITIEIGGKVTGHGSRPLVLLATNAIVVRGTIDVASRTTASVVGAGADAGCATGTPPGACGGGYGGSFGTRGGDGGRGQNGSCGMTASMAPPAVVATTVRGGCAGSAGSGPTPPAGGHGGGAVYLVAGSSIMLVGATIDASGGGGIGGLTATGGDGGGGGGAGGLVALDAPTVTLDATTTIYANGGGGGGGAGTQTDGNPGGDPMQFNAPAQGGFGGAGCGTCMGGQGGNGAAGGSSVGTGSSLKNSGGGGGGGLGALRVFSAHATIDATALSPSPS
jgi:hypothetical protein